MTCFLFPSDPFDRRQPDEAFRPQADALARRGHGFVLFSFEELQAGRAAFRGPPPGEGQLVYRGWMMTAGEYQALLDQLAARGASLLTSLDAYLLCHHLPRWYPLLGELTAETRVYPPTADLGAEIAALDWGKVFVKDYVKSLKTSVGAVVSRPEDASLLASEMAKYRGTIEGGFCVRRFESFREGSETRYFVLGGVPHAAAGAVPEIVRRCAERIPSPFFSVDVALRDDGRERVVEVGDGQVSDLVGWSADAFAELWRAAPRS